MLPIHLWIIIRCTLIGKSINLCLIIHGRKAIIKSGLIHGFSISGSIHKISRLGVEHKFVVIAHLHRQFLFGSALGFNQDGTIQSLIAINGCCSAITQHRHRFDLIHGQIVDRALDAIHQNQYIILACGLSATDIECGPSTVIANKLSVVKYSQSQQPAIQSFFQRGSSRVLQLLPRDSMRGIGRELVVIIQQALCSNR